MATGCWCMFVITGRVAEPTMAKAHSLDRFIGADLPRLASATDLAAFESTPYAERIAAQSTYEALQIGAAIDPQAPAIQFLSKADPDEPPVTITHAQFIGRVTQAANLFAGLGVGPSDVVSFLLPLVPQAFFTLFGAQAAGIANPVNPLLSAGQIGEILRAADTRVLVTLGPVPGSDIWDKVQQIKDSLPRLKAILVVHGAAAAGPGVQDFDALIGQYPADRLTSGRQIAASDIAGYFHTGGTTGTPKLVRHTHANQVSQAWGLRLTGIVAPGQGLLFGLPLFHVGGALTQGLAMLANGGHVVVLSALGWRNPRALQNVWRLVQRFRPQWTEQDFNDWRMVTVRPAGPDRDARAGSARSGRTADTTA